MLIQDNLLWNTINILVGHRLRETDRTVTVAPMFHIGGLEGAAIGMVCGFALNLSLWQ